MAPQNGGFGPRPGFVPGDDSGNSPFDNPGFAPSSASSSIPAPSSSAQFNVPLLSMGLALGAFLLVCVSICACAYRRAKARNRTTRHLNTEEGSVEYVGLGIDSIAPTPYLKAEEDKDVDSEHAPPAYSSVKPKSVRGTTPPASPKLASNTTPRILVSPSPAIAVAPSPALSTISLSPALSQHEAEGARLLTISPMPPPPSYARF